MNDKINNKAPIDSEYHYHLDKVPYSGKPEINLPFPLWFIPCVVVLVLLLVAFAVYMNGEIQGKIEQQKARFIAEQAVVESMTCDGKN